MRLGIAWIKPVTPKLINWSTHWAVSVPVEADLHGFPRNRHMEGVMAYSSNRLPSRFPVGTKLVIEGRRTGEDGAQIYSRYLEFPDGTFLPLPSRPARPEMKAVRSPHRRRRSR
jgi:hypothetical protein